MSGVETVLWIFVPVTLFSSGVAMYLSERWRKAQSCSHRTATWLGMAGFLVGAITAEAVAFVLVVS